MVEYFTTKMYQICQNEKNDLVVTAVHKGQHYTGKNIFIESVLWRLWNKQDLIQVIDFVVNSWHWVFPDN